MTTTATHTPGPWHLYRSHGKTYVVTDPQTQPFRGHMIASETTCPESQANLQLISAAPALLAACRLALPAMEFADSTGLRCRGAIEAVEAAIKQAEGEQ